MLACPAQMLEGLRYGTEAQEGQVISDAELGGGESEHVGLVQIVYVG